MKYLPVFLFIFGFFTTSYVFCSLAENRGAEDAKAGFPPREVTVYYLRGYKAWYDCEKHFLETGYNIHGELKRPDLFKGVE